jgi:hypothetical protein
MHPGSIFMLTPPGISNRSLKLWEERWIGSIQRVASFDGIRYWTFTVMGQTAQITI